MKKQFPSALNDYVFKLIFGDQRNVDILADFLQSVLTLPPDEYDYLTIIDPFIKREEETGKMSILDVKVHTTTGRIIDVEIQVAPAPEMAQRMLSYAAGLLRGQIRKGGKYEDVRQVICIVITNFVMAPEEKDYFNEISLRYAASGREFTDALKFITLELPKLPRQDDAKEVWGWLSFLKSQRKEELMELVERNPRLRKPVGILMKLSDDERESLIFEAQERFRMDTESRIDWAKRQGAKEQEEKEKREIARKMKTDGLPLEKISGYTGLSADEIQAL
ncbi:MAG: Rpn family recombination-promoting nuclease/putative transposase [Spirochaetales bacterium]|jgi:predicted transposase/invertase (TIGR01784 family)|nr:Rpn family recombination-promoting nuclease/putative transposase [Spirochaetales bacterium]